MPAPSVEQFVPERALLSIVIPTYNEEANVASGVRAAERGARAGSTSMRDHLQRRPVDGSHRARDPRAQRTGPARQDAPVLPAIRPARGDVGGDACRRRRCVRRHRLRPPGSSGAHRRDGRALARRVRCGLRAAEVPRRRDGAKRIVSAVGYRLIRRIADVDIPPNTGDFRLMSRRVVRHVVAINESHGFLRGLVAVVGFPQTQVLYDRDAAGGW